MKKILIGLFILSSTTVFAQDNRDDRNQNRNVPPEIQRSFQRDYPNSPNPQWENRNGQWHGTYRDNNNRNVETYYNNNGQRIDTHIPYNREELPSRVRDRADRRYHSNYNTFRIERPSYQPLFQIKIQTGRTLYMDENGRKRRYQDRH